MEARIPVYYPIRIVHIATHGSARKGKMMIEEKKLIVEDKDRSYIAVHKRQP